jgi:hypothetical protein
LEAQAYREYALQEWDLYEARQQLRRDIWRSEMVWVFTESNKRRKRAYEVAQQERIQASGG